MLQDTHQPCSQALVLCLGGYLQLITVNDRQTIFPLKPALKAGFNIGVTR